MNWEERRMPRSVYWELVDNGKVLATVANVYGRVGWWLKPADAPRSADSVAEAKAAAETAVWVAP